MDTENEHTWSRVDTLIIILIIIVVAVVALIIGTALARRSDSDKAAPRQVEVVDDYQLYLVDYRGSTLHCIDMKPNSNDGTSCDYDRFYDEHPELTRRPG